jgi:RNA polymerase sigma factor (sigma-70 family)
MTIFADDRELLARFRRGDRAALTTVYRRYVDEVATLARRGFTIESSGHTYIRGVDRDAEHELVQETFAKAFVERARLAYDGVQPFRPYLLRITKNLMIDRFRAKQRSVVELDGMGVGDLEHLLATNTELPAEPEDLDWTQRVAVAKQFTATLDAETQRIVRLRFEDERSQDDVAAELGCSRRRVRTVERDVQVELRKWLQQRGLLDA